MTWREAARLGELDPGSAMRFAAGGHEYLLVLTTEGRWLAADLSCTHRFAELDTTGALVGTQVTCFSHGATFDLAAGGRVVTPAVASGATPPLRTFPIRVEGERVLVDIPEGDKPPEPPWS